MDTCWQRQARAPSPLVWTARRHFFDAHDKYHREGKTNLNSWIGSARQEETVFLPVTSVGLKGAYEPEREQQHNTLNTKHLKQNKPRNSLTSAPPFGSSDLSV